MAEHFQEPEAKCSRSFNLRLGTGLNVTFAAFCYSKQVIESAPEMTPKARYKAAEL